MVQNIKYFFKNVCSSFRFLFFFSKIKEAKCPAFSSPLLLSMLREKKLFRTRGHACSRKCCILGVIVPKNSITLLTLIPYCHRLPNHRASDQRNGCCTLGILKVTSKYKISTTARNLVPFRKIFHYIKTLDGPPQRWQIAAGDSPCRSVSDSTDTNFIQSAFRIALFLADLLRSQAHTNTDYYSSSVNVIFCFFEKTARN